MNRIRTQSGESLVSILVGTLLMALVGAALCSLMCLNTKETSGYYNRVDVVNAAREALDRITRNVRSARSIGDMYGVVPPASAPVVDITQISKGASTNVNAVDGNNIPLAALEDGTAFLSSTEFPSAGDPYYGSGQSPPGGWPSGWPSAPYALSGTTLILQVPVFNTQPINGQTMVWPEALQNPGQGALNPGNLEAMDTYVYQVLPDPSRGAGMYKLEVAAFPASPDTNVPSGTCAPTTILTGLVGPLDQSGNICVFQYVDKVSNAATSSPDPTNIANYSGVVVNLEVKKQDEGVKSAVLALRSEAYMRNNSLSGLMGAPPPG